MGEAMDVAAERFDERHDMIVVVAAGFFGCDTVGTVLDPPCEGFVDLH